MKPILLLPVILLTCLVPTALSQVNPAGFQITFAPDSGYTEIRLDLAEWSAAVSQPLPPDPSTAWRFAGTGLGGAPGSRYTVTQSGMVSTLRIARPDYSDEGIYECAISGTGGQPTVFTTVELLLQPLAPPYLTVTARSPDSRTDGGMVYDSQRARTVLFGGEAFGLRQCSGNPEPGRYFSNDTWERDGWQWIKRTPLHSPPPLTQFGIAYDSHRGRTIVFGGFKYLPPTFTSAVVSNEVWEWDGADWFLMPSTTPSPPARTKASLCYDSVRREVLMLGGDSFDPLPQSPVAATNALWAWNGTAWNPRTSLPVPSLGGAPEMFPGNAFSFDPGRGVAVLLGPFFDSEQPVWEWDGVSWKRVVPSGPIKLRDSRFTGSAFYDPFRRRVGLPSSSHSLSYGGAQSLPIILWWDGKEFLRGDTGTLDDISNLTFTGASESGPSGPVDFTAFDTRRRCLVWLDSPNFFYAGSATTREMHFSKAVLPVHQPVEAAFFPGAPSTRIRIISAGLRPLTYQWLKNGVPISFPADLRLSGEGTPTLTIANPTLADAGIYTALITNPLGAILTSPVPLLYQTAPLSVIAQDHGLVLTWSDERAILECSTSLQGTWVPNFNAFSPHVIAFDRPRQFFRLRQP